MPYCEACRVTYVAGKFCPKHGSKLVEWRCPKCNNYIKPNMINAYYCDNCGANLKENPLIKKEAT